MADETFVEKVEAGLTDARKAAMAAGLEAYHAIQQEAEELKGKLAQYELDIKAKDLEILSLRSQLNAQLDAHSSAVAGYESRISTHQAERDLATRTSAEAHAILGSIDRVLSLVRDKLVTAGKAVAEEIKTETEKLERPGKPEK